MRGNCYDVTGAIRTTDAGAVGTEVIRLYRKLFASADAEALERAFADAVRTCLARPNTTISTTSST
jgi:hypothetical protein